MDSTTATVEPKSAELQFDKVEFAEQAPATTCVACKQVIAGTYFQVNDQVACPNCRDLALAALTGGSGSRRFLRSLAWGGIGAIAGAALWMTITRLTGWEIGLIAIVVGWLVGCGVRKGAEGRGGWLYQSLAVVLTYIAIVSTYVPDVHKGFMESQASGSSVSRSATDGSTAAVAQPGSSKANEAVGGGAVTGESPMSPLIALPLYGIFLFAVASALPFLAFPENVIGLLIIGFALFEAWKLNKRGKVEVTGPFEVTTQAQSEVATTP